MTAGAAGAVAVSKHQCLTVPAFRANVLYTHGAGAAFSRGLLYGLLQDWEMQDCLDLAAAVGALRCERKHNESIPMLDELREYPGSR